MSAPIKREDIQVGDLVEATKGERVVRDRITKPGGSIFTSDCYIGTPALFGPSSVDSFIANGYKVELIERPVVLPDEPGTVIAIGEWWLVKLRGWMSESSGGWELLPGTKEADASVRRAGQKTQCVYSNEWVLAEVEQDRDGFRIISAPVVNA